jgi:transcription initiation factor TFIIH subunit 4
VVPKNNKAARQVLKDFGKFGLVYFCRVADKTSFYPTGLVVNLIASNEKARSFPSSLQHQENVAVEITGGGGAPSVAATRSLEESLSASIPSRSHLAVIVQTNFQVVAYTTSKLHISTLCLFCDISSFRRLPNVIFFFITRDSIKAALRLGVTASQILRFLHVHAHPMLRNSNSGDVPLVPANVRDQILLWDRERRRVVMDEVRIFRYLYSRASLFSLLL